MWDAIVIVGCYAFACSFLRLLGGLGAAEDALRKWGASESRRRAPELLDKLHRRGAGNGA
jgi:hypothetical protein